MLPFQYLRDSTKGAGHYCEKNPNRMVLDPDAKHQPEGVLFAIMTGSLDIIPLITWLFTKQINNMTQNIDLNIILLILKNLFDSTVGTVCIAT